jgi:hypothetical protein
MKRQVWAAILCFTSLFSGCTEDDFCNCFKRTGSTVTEVRSAEAFKRIELYNNIDLEIVPDTFHKIEVTCGENLVDGISTDVVNGQLVIRNNNKCNWMRDLNNRFVVKVTVKKLEFILSQGSGDIRTLDTIRTSPFLIESYNGTGTYSFLFNSQKVELKLHSGPADIKGYGFVQDLFIFSAANGYIHTEQLVSKECTVITKSTGDVKVNVIDKLDAEIGYSGDVLYGGSPIITRTGTGSGQLLPL